MKRWYDLLLRLVLAAETMARQVGMRRELQEQRIDELETMLREHIYSPRHINTPKRKKGASHDEPQQAGRHD